MKNIYSIIAGLLMTASVFLPHQASAQAPEKMSYQAVVRDGSNNLVSSASVGIQISVLQGSASGTAVYVETQTPTSNANGLVSLEIGAGSAVSGYFSTIDWTSGPYFIKTETDPTGGTNYTITGTSQLLSVPYALYAENAGNSTAGPQGPAGLDGNGIASTVDNGDGTFTFTYDDGSTFTTSDLTGPTGAQGPVGATGPQGSQGVQGPQGPVGADGNGIASTTDNGDGTFTFTYDDGSTFTTSDLTGPQGANGQGGVTTAGTNVTVTGAGTIADPYVVNSSQEPGTSAGEMLYWNGTAWVVVTPGFNGQILKFRNGQPTWEEDNINNLSVGDHYQGGIIAYFLEPSDPGYDANVRHGLIVEPSNQSISLSGIQWSITHTATGATGYAIGTGQANTTAIVTNQGGGSYAAQICNDLVIGAFSDWYLPSIDELAKLYLNKAAIGNFFSGYHWSSTENDMFGAWRLDFANGNQNVLVKDGSMGVIGFRAVRSF